MGLARRVGGIGLVAIGGALLAAAPARAALVAYEFSTTLNLSSISGPSSANLLFHVQYDPSLPGNVSSGGGNTNGVFGNGVSGSVFINGTEVGTLYSEIYLTETITLDAVTILFSQEAGAGQNNYSDNVPYFWDINQIRLSWGDSSRQMLTSATALPPNFDSFAGKPWSVQFDIYGNNAGTFGSLWGVRTINSPTDQPLNWQGVALPEPSSLASVVGLAALGARRRARK